MGAPGVADPGAAYVYEGTAWQLAGTLEAPDREPSFGASVDLSGNRAVVGAPLGSPFEGPSSDGNAFVYGFDGRAWSLTDRVAPESGPGRMAFSTGVSIQGRTVVAGAPQDGTVGPSSGVAYLFEVPFAVGIDDAPVAVANSVLSSPYPNPSTAEARFTLALQAPDYITVTVYDALGRAVGSLPSTKYTAGTHTLRLGSPTWPPGLYVVRVMGKTVAASRTFTRVQ